MTLPIDIACNHMGCDAQPSEKCRERKDLGSTWIELDTFHEERIADAGGWMGPGNPPSEIDFENAILADRDLF